MKILLVEDEQRLSTVIAKGLKKQGFAVDCALDGEEALYSLEVNQYDLVVLDLDLPKINGFDVLETLRQEDNQTKVLILSAKNQVEDKVHGLDLGANDYLEKPFDFSELTARIRNLLRWDFKVQQAQITWQDLRIDLNTQEVSRGDTAIALTNKEYGILEYLATNNNRFIKAEEIIEHVWDSDVDLFSNSFKFHMSQLKKKLQTPNAIQTIRGKGYKFGGTNEDT